MKNQGVLTRVMCTFVFTLFCFYYLYCYQADLLTVTQHILSKGQTHYNHFVGAVLITILDRCGQDIQKATVGMGVDVRAFRTLSHDAHKHLCFAR